jgi:hypothetical protein
LIAADHRGGAGKRRDHRHGLRGRLPVFPGRRYLDWELEDPAGEDPATVRRIRDDIDIRVRALLADVLRGAGEPEPLPAGDRQQ